MAVAEQQSVAAGRPQAGDHAVGAGTDVGDRLAPRAAVAEEVPARPLRADLGGPPALVRAVVPLGQVGDDLGDRREAGQLAGAAGARERADQDAREGQPPEPIAEVGRVPLAPLGQGQVGPAGVPVGDRPGRLAVPRQVDFRKRLGHGSGLGSLCWDGGSIKVRPPECLSISIERPRACRCRARRSRPGTASGGRAAARGRGRRPSPAPAPGRSRRSPG